MQRFFIEPWQLDEPQHLIHIKGEDVNHIKNVLRMKAGEELWVSDGEKKEYHCRIEELLPDEVLLRILYAQGPEYELKSRIYLFQGLPKADKMELIIQKAVELGAFAIVPVSTRRCVVKLDEQKARKKAERWQEIARSAAKQSKRLQIPQVFPVRTWKEALELAEDLDVVLIPYELYHGMQKTRETLSAIRPGQSIGVLIGPEGGFEEEEVQQALERGALPVSLGRRILRTETAGMTMLSVLMMQLEED
ncbi:MAG: 16S rRNA (uracil(1498)-N(3))-methyltransferase [Blautia sp.]|nr:16S rRNA (uracil(1498)-N(3))-methyltransferase [Blautia sp.]